MIVAVVQIVALLLVWLFLLLCGCGWCDRYCNVMVFVDVVVTIVVVAVVVILVWLLYYYCGRG